jgi:hypothetical protein
VEFQRNTDQQLNLSNLSGVETVEDVEDVEAPERTTKAEGIFFTRKNQVARPAAIASAGEVNP